MSLDARRVFITCPRGLSLGLAVPQEHEHGAPRARDAHHAEVVERRGVRGVRRGVGARAAGRLVCKRVLGVFAARFRTKEVPFCKLVLGPLSDKKGTVLPAPD